MNLYDKASLIVIPNAYKASKIYSAKPTDGSGDLAFSRSSTAMRRNIAGLWESVAVNVPRLHYPVGGGCPVWLIEPESANMFFSSDFTENTNWFPVNCSKVLNSIQSPKEGFLATKVVEDTSNGVHINVQINSGASNATYTISFYAKTNGRNVGVFNSGSGDPLDCSFNLTLGTASGSGSPTIKDAGNGWWFCTCQYNPSTSSFNIQLRLLNGTASNYLGDGVSGAYIWNPQMELGTNATSPIITEGAAVTRTYDTFQYVIDMGDYGVNMAVGYTYAFKLKDCLNPINQGSVFGTNGNGINSNAGNVAGTTLSSISITDDNRMIVVRKQAGFTQMWINGLTNTPTANTEIDDRLFPSYTASNGKNLEKILLYNLPLTDAECLALSNL